MYLFLKQKCSKKRFSKGKIYQLLHHAAYIGHDASGFPEHIPAHTHNASSGSFHVNVAVQHHGHCCADDSS